MKQTDLTLPAHTKTYAQQYRESGGSDIIVVDNSASMKDHGFPLGRHFTGKRTKIECVAHSLHGYLDAKAEFRPNDHVAFIVYNNRATLLCNPLHVGDNHRKLADIVTSLPDLPSGGTRLHTGLRIAREIIDEIPRTPQTLEIHLIRTMALSDGYDADRDKALRQAAKIKKAGVLLEILGVGKHSSDVDEALLRSVATDDCNGNHYRFLGDENSLVDTFRKAATGMLTVDD